MFTFLQESYLAMEFLNLVNFAKQTDSTAEGLISKISQENGKYILGDVTQVCMERMYC